MTRKFSKTLFIVSKAVIVFDTADIADNYVQRQSSVPITLHMLVPLSPLSLIPPSLFLPAHGCFFFFAVIFFPCRPSAPRRRKLTHTNNTHNKSSKKSGPALVHGVAAGATVGRGLWPLNRHPPVLLGSDRLIHHCVPCQRH